MARWAPSNCNIQGWRFIIIDSDKTKQELIDNGGAIVIKNAPQGILVLYEDVSDNIEYKDHIQSAAAAIQNLCLYAHSQGIGTCWICHLPRKATLRKIFSIPKQYDPIAYVMIGYPKKKNVDVKRRFSMEEIISKNKFQFEFNEKSVVFKRLLRKIYFLLPKPVKKIINPLIDRNFVKKFDN